MTKLNIINAKAIDKAINNFAVLQRGPIKAWLKTVVRNYVLRTPDFHELLTYFILSELPEWAQKAAERDEYLHRFDYYKYRDFMIEVLAPVLDWLQFLPETDRHIRNIHKLSVPDAIRLSAEWHEMLDRKKVEDATEDEDGIKPFLALDDGYCFVEITSEVSIQREGTIMGHCVGSYWDRVNKNTCKIFSLRDAHNVPHVTIEVIRDCIQQVQGKANTRPLNYIKQIREFLNYSRFEITSYVAHSLGFIYFNHKLYTTHQELINDANIIVDKLSANGYITNRTLLLEYFNYIRNSGETLSYIQQVRLLNLITKQKTRLKTRKGIRGVGPNSFACITIQFPDLIYLIWQYSILPDYEDRLLHALKAIGKAIIKYAQGRHDWFYTITHENNVTMSAEIFTKLGLKDEFESARDSALKIKSDLVKKQASEIRQILNGKDRDKIPAHERLQLQHQLQTHLPWVRDHLLTKSNSAIL